MDAKEARKFTTNNPPVDIQAERRPSLLGRLFGMGGSMDASGIPATSFNQSLDGQRRESITEAVQSQYMNMNQAPKKVAGVPDGEFSLFT